MIGLIPAVLVFVSVGAVYLLGFYLMEKFS